MFASVIAVGLILILIIMVAGLIHERSLLMADLRVEKNKNEQWKRIPTEIRHYMHELTDHFERTGMSSRAAERAMNQMMLTMVDAEIASRNKNAYLIQEEP